MQKKAVGFYARQLFICRLFNCAAGTTISMVRLRRSIYMQASQTLALSKHQKD